MKFTSFITGILREGSVAMQIGSDEQFSDDTETASRLLKQCYEQDIVEMPFRAPEFCESAALWAARFLYHAVQLIISRDAGKDIVHNTLSDYPGAVNADSMYAADLMLRYLPDVLGLAKGLAPADTLVSVLKNIAGKWPLSSVGIETDNCENENMILKHSSLRIHYADRIILHKDLKRLDNPEVEAVVMEIMGMHTYILWPELQTRSTLIQ